MSDTPMSVNIEESGSERQNTATVSTSVDNVDREVTPEVEVAKEKRPAKPVDLVIDTIASVVANTVRQADQIKVRDAMRSVLGTLFSLGSLPEATPGLRIDGEVYRYREYSVTAWMQQLMPAKRVVWNDVPSAIDFLKRDYYRNGYRTLTPGEFAATWRFIRAKARISDAGLSELHRDEIKILTEVIASAVVSGCVKDRRQSTIYFLSSKFDDEACVGLQEWARTFATNSVLT